MKICGPKTDSQNRATPHAAAYTTHSVIVCSFHSVIVFIVQVVI